MMLDTFHRMIISISISILLLLASPFRSNDHVLFVVSATTLQRYTKFNTRHQRGLKGGKRTFVTGDSGVSGTASPSPIPVTSKQKGEKMGKTDKKSSAAPSFSPIENSSTPSKYVSNDEPPSTAFPVFSSPTPSPSVATSGMPSFVSAAPVDAPFTLEPTRIFTSQPSEGGSIDGSNSVHPSTFAPHVHHSHAPFTNVPTSQPSFNVLSPSSQPSFLPSSSPLKKKESSNTPTQSPTLSPSYNPSVVSSHLPSRLVSSNVPSVTSSSPDSFLSNDSGLSINEETVRLVHTLSPMATDMDEDAIVIYESSVQSFLSQKLSTSNTMSLFRQSKSSIRR